MQTDHRGEIVFFVLLFCMALLLPAFCCSDDGTTAKRKCATLDDFKNKLALWDAEGQHLTMAEIETAGKEYGAGIYIFRFSDKNGLDLKKLKGDGWILIKTAHPNYAPFDDEEFLKDRNKVLEWAKAAANEPYVDGVMLDVEHYTATSYMYTIQMISEETRKAGKLFHAAPHFSLDRWNDTKEHVEVEDYNKYVDVAWPWLYNRFRQPTYQEGLLKVVNDWKAAGVKVPIYPIFDWGRPHYGGISAEEASQVPAFLRKNGIETVCIFQPHVSFRERDTNPDYAKLWNDLRDNFGTLRQK